MKLPTPLLTAMSLRSLSLASALLLAGVLSPAFGQATWTGHTDANWETNDNWSGTIPASSGSDSLTFNPASLTGAAIQSTNNDLTAFTATGITFNNSTTAGAFTLAGNQITLAGNIITTGATGSPTHEISLNMALSGNRTLELATNNRLLISGIISQGAAGSLRIAHAIFNQTGLVTLSGNNTYTGGTIVGGGNDHTNFNNGSLYVTHNNALGTGPVTVQGTNSFLRLANGLNISNSFISGNVGNSRSLRVDANATAEYSGTITNSGGGSIFEIHSPAGSTFTLSGVISGTGTSPLTFNQPGTVIISNNNTYTSRTDLSGTSVVRISNNAALGSTSNHTTVASGASLQLTNNITVAERVDIAGNAGGNGALRNFSGSNTWTGEINLTAASEIQADTGTTLTLDPSSGNAIAGAFNLTLDTVGTGAIIVKAPIAIAAGTLTKNGAGTLTLEGTSTYTGTTTISDGILQLGNGENTGSLSASSVITNNAILRFNRSNTMTQGTDFSTAGIGGTGAVQLFGNGAVILNAVNTYSGSTTISAGTLVLSGSGSINSTSGITVNNGGTLSYSSSTGLNRDITLNTGGTFSHNGSNAYTGTLTWNGGTLAGTNFSGVSLTVGANKTLSPGNSPGTMVTASQTWENGGNYNLQIFDFAQAAGTGFDTIAITGTLDLTAVTAGGFNINLWSLSAIGPDVDGDALNFDNLASGSWLIVSTTGGISGFDASKFDIHVGANNGTAGFSNDLGGGTFTVSHLNDNLYLEFIPIPEPSSVLLLGLGLATLMLRKRCSIKKI